MNVRLQTLLLQAESLPDDRQDVLADLVESFMVSEEDLVSPEELEELKRIEAEPDQLADPEEVRAFFAGRLEPAAFTPEEIAHLDRLAAEPFVEADPEEIAALFGRRG